MQELTIADHDILKYVNKYTKKKKFSAVPSAELNKHFGKKYSVLSLRLNILENEFKYIAREKDCSLSPSGRPLYTYKDSYTITEAGEKALQDFTMQRRYEYLLAWTRNFWMPVLVALATSLLYQIVPDIISWLLRQQ